MEDIETDIGDGYSPPSQINKIGLILDVIGETLSKLIRFDNNNSFILNYFKDLKPEEITLINGNKNINFYTFNNLLQTSYDSLENYSKNNLSTLGTFYNYLFGKKSISDIIDEENIFKTIKKNNTSFELVRSEKINKTILDIKNILSTSFSGFNQEKFMSSIIIFQNNRL